MLRQRSSGGPEEAPLQSLVDLRERLIKEGPTTLKPKEKLRLLWDADTVFWLYQELWSRPANELHPTWPKLFAQSSSSSLLSRYLMAV